MGHLVRLVVGDWKRQSYSSLLAPVRERYKLDLLLLPTEPVLLTYKFPNWRTEPGDYTTPPIEIKEDGDVELFMSLYVAFGGRNVDLYRKQKEEEDGIDNEEDQGPEPKSVPWKGMI
ncbi:Uncharacterized protein Rs2_34489 [Raphanus sativus]|nr:Uncharacterized protein Rs2_34489 [Raphanus sativus]